MATIFLQVIPTILYRKPRLDVTCLVLYIERPERPGFRRKVLELSINSESSIIISGRPIIMRNTMVRRVNVWRNQLELLLKLLEIV